MFLFNTIYLKYTILGLSFLSLFIVAFMIWKKKYNGLEAGLHVIITVFLMWLFNSIAHNSIPDLVRQEFINGSVTRVVWEESYQYWKTETHSSGSGKNRRTWTTTRLVTVPDEFYIDTTAGDVNTSKEMFLKYAQKFNFVTFPSEHWNRIKDDSGRRFQVNVPAKTIGVSVMHEYDNYISANRGVLSSRNPKLEGIFSKEIPAYPGLVYDNEYGVTRISERIIDRDKVLTDIKKKELEAIVDDFQTKNASIKQCNIIFVITKNTSYDYFLALKSLWKSGNKNDIVIVMNDNLKFVDVIAYTQIDKFSAGIQNIKYQDKYTDAILYNNMTPQEITESRIKMLIFDSLRLIEKQYVRLPMAVFESYKNTLTIPVKTDIWLSIWLTIIQSVAFIIFYIYDIGGVTTYNRNYNRRRPPNKPTSPIFKR